MILPANGFHHVGRYIKMPLRDLRNRELDLQHLGQATSFWIRPGEQRQQPSTRPLLYARKTTKRPIQQNSPIRNSIWTRIFHFDKIDNIIANPFDANQIWP